MTDTPPRRRPTTVPGPTSAPGGGGAGIAAQAIAVREQQRDNRIYRERDADLPTAEDVRGIMKPQAGLGALPSNPPNIATHRSPTGKITGAIANVMREVGTIQMTGYNSFHRYRYPKMEDILPVITPLMGDNGLVIHQNEIEIKNAEGQRPIMAVTYEFTVYHVSGESLPPARHTGSAQARDSRGNWDDKAIAKCHTNARKFHLQALFEIPMELPDNEPDDKDKKDANQRKSAVPGPASKEPITEQGPPLDKSVPHKITLGGGAGPEQWSRYYLSAIAKTKSKEEIDAWDAANDQSLELINMKYPAVYEKIVAAVDRRLADLEGKPDAGIPADSTEAMNWIAERLQGFKAYEDAEKFWNEVVAPREEGFDDEEWNMLMKEWERTEARLNPPDDEPEAA